MATAANASPSEAPLSFLVCSFSPDHQDINKEKLASSIPVYLNVHNQTVQMLQDEKVWQFQSLTTPMTVLCTIKQKQEKKPPAGFRNPTSPNDKKPSDKGGHKKLSTRFTLPDQQLPASLPEPQPSLPVINSKGSPAREFEPVAKPATHSYQPAIEPATDQQNYLTVLPANQQDKQWWDSVEFIFLTLLQGGPHIYNRFSQYWQQLLHLPLSQLNELAGEIYNYSMQVRGEPWFRDTLTSLEAHSLGAHSLEVQRFRKTMLALIRQEQEIREVIDRARQQGISVDLQRIQQNLQMVLEANLSDSLVAVMNTDHQPLTTEQKKAAGESFLRAAMMAVDDTEYDPLTSKPVLTPVETTLKHQDSVFYKLASSHNDHNLLQILQNRLMLLEVKLDEELCRLSTEQGTVYASGTADGCGGIVLGMVAHPEGEDKKEADKKEEEKKVAGVQNGQPTNSQPSSTGQQPIGQGYSSDTGAGGRGNNNEPCHDHVGSTCPHPDCNNGPCRCHECLQAGSIQSEGIRKQRLSAKYLHDSIPRPFQALLELKLPPETIIRQLYPLAHIIRETSDTEAVTERHPPRRPRRLSAPDLAMPTTGMATALSVVQASTEGESRYTHLENKTIKEILKEINDEDWRVPVALEASSGTILKLLQKVQETIKRKGRVFLIGAGSSGRLAIVSSIPDPQKLVALIAGGDEAIATSKGGAEDNYTSAWRELSEVHNINRNDLLIGITASGRTPYAVGALAIAREQGIPTGSIACSRDTKISRLSDTPVETYAGPEYITGSTRMKSATTQKIILDMISRVAIEPDQDLNALLQRFIKGSAEIARALSHQLPQLEALVEKVVPVIQNQGRLIYLGTESPGRLVVIDASECPPTFGVKPETVTGLIEGGSEALRRTLTTAQKERTNAWEDLQSQGASSNDIVTGVGIEGLPEYVQKGLTKAKATGIATASIMVQKSTSEKSDHNAVVISLPVSENPAEYEALAGTAIKQALNMLTTAVMIKHGRVADKWMSHMQASNEKLVAREAVNLARIEGITLLAARALLTIFKSTAASIEYRKKMREPPKRQ
ncbi:N-acetylmuramic acid 6-phosphate etherase [Endozoicomonas gorgoniicola]|uniref:N-acetylmuramic acid 6-phosphate etherase n=1 Tax=Endozoicomonas gorgoniicola TaxID=1234144 RepID=A0ABT3N354_9GAMM|nr:N-acetylmuramic acid 6-phosphate etherase [Endozoicomonas gorgoniicola]MCW7556050.1 N-acetylmuramic acid 6-phosphate etherase [Endozoicomonas gorgoniicola]